MALLALSCFGAAVAVANSREERPAYTPVEELEPLDDGTSPRAGKSLGDTIWIADWTFDAPDGSCDETGWVKYDNRVLNDGSNYWEVTTDYTPPLTGYAAALRKQDLCTPCHGFFENWDYSLVLEYSGANATLAFRFLVDTAEPDYTYIVVEGDSLGLSESRVNYAIDPGGTPATFREVLFIQSEPNLEPVTAGPIQLPDYGPGEHEVYIRFAVETAGSCDDASTLGAPIVVDDIVVTGGIAYAEDFECGALSCLNSHVRPMNTAPSTPFGEWARLYKHITDNDKCTENTTCAWLWTDPTRFPYFSDMAFGPGGAVIHSWLDDIIVSPWVSLSSTPAAYGTILSFRRFPGNRFTSGGVVQGWRVRGKTRVADTDTSSPGDSIDCVTAWGHASSFNSLNTFAWITSIFDATPYFPLSSTEVQVSFRVSDWRYLTGAPSGQFGPGPGPFTDRVRIGRRILAGPVFDIGLDARFQAQDNFASEVNAITPGEHHSPATDRFGTCDFRQGTDQGTNLRSTQIVSGDSVTMNVLDARQVGGITAVIFCGAIVAGPHAGKAPSPYTVGANGFFEVSADSSRDATGAVVANRWFVDLDDTYLRGGDQLVYYWYATDAGGGSSSAPVGLDSSPASVAVAEGATGGLFNLTSLPVIDWASDYLERIAADPHGDVDPTAEEVAASSQRNCVLYYQHMTSNRRSGTVNRTSFMRTLDVLGYGGDYDVFDVQGYGNTNNQLASRATIEQCTGYQLIIEDDGRSNLIPNIPDGGNTDNEKVRQSTFYRNWLDAGSNSEAGRATLWVLGESSVAEFPTNTLFTTYCGIGSVVQSQSTTLNPDVVGNGSFAFAPSSCSAEFTNDRFALNGGCPAIRNYDGFVAGGTAVTTHHYQSAAMPGPGAILMNARPATNANTIVMGFAWSDIRDPSCAPPNCPAPIVPPAKVLMSKILSCVLTPNCQEAHDPTDSRPTEPADVPAVSALHPNVPNPFNPTTIFAFDLARSGHVVLNVFDVAGRRVRTLLDGEMPAGRAHQVTWNGLDEAGRRAASGVYLVRLTAPEFTSVRRAVLLE